MVLLRFLEALDYGKIANRSVMAFLFGIIVLGFIFPMVLKFVVKSVSIVQINIEKSLSKFNWNLLNSFIRLILATECNA